jgi:predicted nicotinamide N-methyase
VPIRSGRAPAVFCTGVGPAAFVREHTRLSPVPFVPEISLRLAQEPYGIWEQAEHEQGGRVLPPPFWAFAWAGGQALARHLLDHPDLVAGRNVLDVASGSGLVAIAAAKAGAGPVLATEVDPFAAAAIAVNARANDAAVAVSLADVLDGDGDGAEVVLAGDVCYEKTMAQRILEFLSRASAGGRDVLVGDPGRAYLPRACLNPVARYDVRVSRALENTDVKRVTVWRLARPNR